MFLKSFNLKNLKNNTLNGIQILRVWSCWNFLWNGFGIFSIALRLRKLSLKNRCNFSGAIFWACQRFCYPYFFEKKNNNISQNKNIRPTDWGLTIQKNILQPVKMLKQPAPEELQKMIFCNCKSGCDATCGCPNFGSFSNRWGIIVKIAHQL